MFRVQFMSPEYSLCPKGPVYFHRVHLMSQSTVYVPEYSLCPQSTVFQFQEYSLCPQSTVYDPRVKFMS